jgi:hypothetical protein
VYTVGGLLVVALFTLLFLGDAALQRRQAAAEADLPPAGERPVTAGAGAPDDAQAFPVPPMDLPHYHGIGVTVSPVTERHQVLEEGTPAANGTPKEVTGA